jgi:hypothetical protein
LSRQSSARRYKPGLKSKPKVSLQTEIRDQKSEVREQKAEHSGEA